MHRLCKTNIKITAKQCRVPTPVELSLAVCTQNQQEEYPCALPWAHRDNTTVERAKIIIEVICAIQLRHRGHVRCHTYDMANGFSRATSDGGRTRNLMISTINCLQFRISASIKTCLILFGDPKIPISRSFPCLYGTLMMYIQSLFVSVGHRVAIPRTHDLRQPQPTP